MMAHGFPGCELLPLYLLPEVAASDPGSSAVTQAGVEARSMSQSLHA